MVSRGKPGVEFRWNLIQTIFLSVMLFYHPFISLLLNSIQLFTFCNFLLVIYSSLYFNITKHFAFKICMANAIILLFYILTIQ